MTNLGNPEVFIGYAHEDLADAKRLYEDLREAGVDAWIDTERLFQVKIGLSRSRKTSEAVVSF